MNLFILRSPLSLKQLVLAQFFQLFNDYNSEKLAHTIRTVMKFKIYHSNIPTLLKRSVQSRIIAEIRSILWEIEKGERRHAEFTYGITPVMRRNTRLKRSKAGWFPRVPSALFSDARYRGYERAERYREKAWTTVKSDEEFIWNDIGSTLVARQRTYSRGEPHCLRKKEGAVLRYPFLLSFLFLYIYIYVFPLLFFFALQRDSREQEAMPLSMMILRTSHKE